MLQKNLTKILALAIYFLSGLLVSACSFVEENTLTEDEQKVEISMIKITAISSLPHSQGLTFFTLDEYLAHLVEMGKQDRPFYELVELNLYKLNIGRGAQFKEAQYFTREELLLKYGFAQ